ncbi:MAG TPA: hypothetical protein ENK18_18595 [Deltaproteobacteria bacterium]|nr:hypothetical protein [Deltaproteobacteria bacterium]
MQSLPSRIAAVLLPSLLACGWVAWMARPLSDGGESDHLVRSLERSLTRRDPQLVVVGNSTIHSDLELRQLSRWQGGEASVKLELPGTTAPTWYLLLRDRVYGAGHQPGWIVVAGPPSSLLEPRLWTPAQLSRTLAVATRLDHETEARLYGERPHERLLSRIAARRGATRRAVVHGIRDLAAGLLFAPYGAGSVIERGSEIAAASYSARLRDVGGEPAAGAVVGRAGQRSGAALSPEASFVPDLVSLARAQGSEILFVALPLLQPPDAELEAATDALGAWLEAESVPFVDLHRLPLSPQEFSDEIHLNEDGRRRLMSELMAALTEARPVRSVPLEVVADLLAGEVSFAGPPPAIHHAPPRWGRTAALVAVQGGAYLPLAPMLAVSTRHGCTPIQILHDGVPQAIFPGRQGPMFPLPEVSDRGGDWVVALRPDRRCDWWAHSGEPWQRVLTRGAEGYRRAPSAEARAALEAGRWIYPADEARFSVEDAAGAELLELSGFALRGEGIGLELICDGAVAASWRLEPERLDGGLVRLELEPLPPGPVVLRIQGEGGGFVYLVRLQLLHSVPGPPGP